MIQRNGKVKGTFFFGTDFFFGTKKKVLCPQKKRSRNEMSIIGSYCGYFSTFQIEIPLSTGHSGYAFERQLLGVNEIIEQYFMK